MEERRVARDEAEIQEDPEGVRVCVIVFGQIEGCSHRLRCFSMGASKCLTGGEYRLPILGWEVEEDA